MVVQRDGVKNVNVGVIVMHQSVLIVQMMYVTNVIVVRKKMIFRHEDFVLDTDSSSKSRLFKSNKLVFMGDGYRAINIMLRNCKDQQTVREKFHAQLNMREKPKFKDNEKPKQEEHLGLKGKKS